MSVKEATFVGMKQGGIRLIAWEADTKEQSTAFFEAIRYAEKHCVNNRIILPKMEGIRLVDLW